MCRSERSLLSTVAREAPYGGRYLRTSCKSPSDGGRRAAAHHWAPPTLLLRPARVGCRQMIYLAGLNRQSTPIPIRMRGTVTDRSTMYFAAYMTDFMIVSQNFVRHPHRRASVAMLATGSCFANPRKGARQGAVVDSTSKVSTAQWVGGGYIG